MERECKGVRVLLKLVGLMGKRFNNHFFECFSKILLTLFSEASNEGVALVVGRATADRRVIENLTLRVVCAGTRARVYALLIFASFVERTIGANDTFGVACRR